MALPHRVFVVRDYLEQERTDRSVKSPDLSPIERNWDILQGHVSARHPTQQSTELLLKNWVRSLSCKFVFNAICSSCGTSKVLAQIFVSNFIKIHLVKSVEQKLAMKERKQK